MNMRASRHGAPVQVAVIGLAVLLGGCAVTKKDCEQVSWEQLGRTDGLSGLGGPGSSANDLLSNCPATGITPDRNAYERGRLSGLSQWCTRDWGALGADDGRRGATARDMNGVASTCAQVSRPVDANAYLFAHYQGLAQYCNALDWSGQGYNAAATGKPLDPGAVHGACRAQGLTGPQRQAYEDGAMRYCRTLDWRALGRKQAQAGKPADAQQASPPACLALGVRPDANAFHAGHEAARAEQRSRLEQQCTSRAMFEAGRSGKGYDSACASLAPSRQAHDGGRHHAQLQAELRGLEAELNYLNTTGFLMKQGKQTRALTADEKQQETSRLNARIRELTLRMDELARPYR
jgi:hypothetical protein